MQEKEEILNLKPFLKWAGGKTWVKKQIDELIKENFKEINNYHEPFLGSGSVFFHLKVKKSFISDLNSELINTYLVIKDHFNELKNELKEHENKHSESYYYNIREWDRLSNFSTICKIKRAARLLYLNKTCFNGLYRVNSQGYFNVPIGFSKKSSINFDYNNLKVVSDFLKLSSIRIENFSFEDVIKNIEKKDLVYFDPPYYKEKVNSFTKYTVKDFAEQDHERLKEICDEIVEKGGNVIISNSNTDFIKKLFITNNTNNKIMYNYTYNVMKAPRTINSNTKKRTKVEELIIYNVNFNK